MAYSATKANETSTLMSAYNADNVNITGGTVADVTQTIGGTTLAATASEFNTLVGLPASVTTTTTPASGTCAVQFVFKDLAGVTLSHAIAGLLIFTGSTGLAIANVTSNAVLTNGALAELKVGYCDVFITTAAGLLGCTVTASSGTYYITFILPNMKILTSTAIVVN